MSTELERLAWSPARMRSHEAHEVLGGIADESAESAGGGYTYDGPPYTTTVPGGGTVQDRDIGDTWD